MHLNVLHWGRHLHPAESFWSKNLSQESWIDHGEWFHSALNESPLITHLKKLLWLHGTGLSEDLNKLQLLMWHLL